MASKRRRTLPAHLVRRIGSGVAVAMLASLMVAAAPGPASATPSRDPVQSQISQDDDKLESVIEEYDRVAGLLVADRAKAAALDTKVERLNQKVSHAQAQLQPVIRRVYEIGSVSTIGLLLDSTSMTSLVNELALSEAFAHRQRKLIASLTSDRDKSRAAKKVLDAAVAKLAAHKADLAAKKRTILAQIAALQKLRQHVPPGDLGGSGPLQPVACPFTPIGGAAGIAVRVACAQIGKPYVWAAAGPTSFDCSGLVVYAWAKAGKRLRHYTGWQWADGTRIKASQLRPGDLVFFYPPTMHHVGIYVGGGWMVNAPHTGDVVRMARISLLPIGGYRRP
jgi:cell wall-associated NlpC family hydrolase